ncbi:hypothetical protein QZH56_35120 [Streptomyces olivoreticuli]|uniref:hypothetical protein n=1 Tax=Streptomyces olivoreticuli TaxID=68246 RepID=UPI00265A1E3A|nr:hypothetical protein [Streptomyces olivoreticuli]WKK23864.1 hypothetical protein QZH56_35120 [Streptomyces olivoreticuli]
MSTAELTAREAARWALRAGLPLEDERHADVAATANHIHAVIATLRDLDFQEIAPATHAIAPEVADASL